MDKPSKQALWITAGVVVIGIVVGVCLPRTGATSNNVKPAAAPVNRLDAKDEATFAKFARDNGYVCNRVVSSRRLLSEPGVSLYCESWVYDFHQKGGRWAITARKGWGQ